MRIRNRSSWLSGRGKVPECSMGFCVAMTKNGWSNGRVSPSTVTWRSSMASRRALWVLGVARLISSASSTCVKIGPAWNTKELLRRSNTETPKISPGSMSLVHWMRRKANPRDLARTLARVVLPMPGKSSISRCPPANRQVSARRIWSSLPRMTRLICATI